MPFLLERVDDDARVRACRTIARTCVDSGRSDIDALGHGNNLCVVGDGDRKFRELDMTIRKRETVPRKGKARAIFEPTPGKA